MASKRIKKIRGGNVIVVDGKVIYEVPLPVAGLMTKSSAYEISEKNEKIRKIAHELGIPSHIDPFMSMAFVLVGEFKNILVVSEDFETVVCAILPILGFVMSVWGLFEKDK